jgi:RNA recognition motif-containing protein
MEYMSKLKGKSFSFVKYRTNESALIAMTRLNGTVCAGAVLTVRVANPRPDKSAHQNNNRNKRQRMAEKPIGASTRSDNRPSQSATAAAVSASGTNVGE